MRIIIAVLAVAIAAAGILFFTASSAHAPHSNDSGKLQISATIFPLADWARTVGGDDVLVHCLVDGTKDPHHFEPSISDAARVTQSQALLCVGLGMDPWAPKLAVNSGSNLAIWTTGDWIAPMKMAAYKEIEIHGSAADEDDDHPGGNDPHFWLDPARAITVVKRLAEEFGHLDPAHKDAYTQRAAAYTAKLDILNREVGRLAADMPKDAQLVTFHDAYGYLFARLKIGIAAVVQVSPGIEPSAKDVAEAVRLMQTLKQKVILREPGANMSAMKTLAQELNARVELLDPMDTEFSEGGQSYVDRLRHDLQVVAGAEGLTLGGEQSDSKAGPEAEAGAGRN